MEDFTLQTDMGKIATRVHGTQNKIEALALHGWLDNLASFDLLAPLLTNLRITAIDLPGHGHSDHLPKGMIYQFSDWLWIFDDILKQTSIRQPVLIGHSMGASVAALYSALFPNSVKALVLIDGLAQFVTPANEIVSRMRNALESRQQVERQPQHFVSVEEAIAKRRAKSVINEMGAKLIVSRNIKKIGQHFEWRTDPRLSYHTPLRMTRDQMKEFFGAIKVPTLIVRAKPGADFPEGDWQEFLQKVPQVRVETLTGQHHIHLEKPQEVSVIINRFLSEICPK